MSVPTALLRQLLQWQKFLGQPKAATASADGMTSQAAEAGLSLLECLMAIAVIVLTVTMITPPLFIAAATRVQNRRAEQALQLAQGEIDRIRVLVAKGEHAIAKLPTVGLDPLADTPAPATPSSQLDSVSDCPGYTPYNDEQLAADVARLVDVDGDCEPDFLLQVFRTAGTVSVSEQPLGNSAKPTDFEIGVRVYSILAQSNLGTSAIQTDPAALQLTSAEGSQRTRPLAVLFSRMVWSEQSNSLCSYHGDQEVDCQF
jgi:type II secretory pathway pseudopilin PulG